jgi:hypothetical protein
LAVATALVGFLCLAGLPVHAQTTSATVSGSVQDSQGGALPGATVTLTSRTQGNTLTATSDAEGRYVFPIVRPDGYTLRIGIQGFKTAERTNVVVTANDRFSAGIITLEVGGIEESVSVSGRVSELQVESGERSFTLDSEALKNIASNGRNVFNFTNLVPGALTQGTAGQENVQVSAFTVNGQRPNSNNMTIDGVANIDTGDNGGNMAQTNIDAIAEFKVLTNAYQAEYGRAVGGQLQVVTKSGSQSFHGSGYWYGRRSDWNANSWTNKRSAAPPPLGSGKLIEKAEASRNDYGYTLGGPIFIPGVFNEEKKKLFFFWSQEYQRRSDPAAERQARVPTALERAGDFSQSVDASGNPFPYIRDYATGLPCNAGNTSGCYQDGGVIGRIPASRLYAPGINALNIYPSPNFTAGSGINFTSQNPNEAPVRQDLLRLDFQASDRWRVTGRYMKTKEEALQAYGTTWAGNGSDHLPMPVLWIHPGSNYMLSATGILSPSMSLEVSFGRAANSLDYQLQDESLFRSAAGLTEMPLLFPDAVQADYIPDMRFRDGRTGNAGFYQTNQGPFTNKNITYDVLANLSKVAGAHSMKFGVYYQHSYKPQSIFASFNSQINFIDDVNNPFDTGYGYANAATGVFNTYTQASKFAIPDWKYKNLEWYAQDNWKVSRKLTLDYGVRFYYLTPQWDTSLQASNFLPDQFDPNNAATLYVPACIGASPCSSANRVALDPNTGQTASSRFIGRLTPGSNRFNGAFQAGQGINDELQDGNAFKISPRFGFTYDLTGKGETIVRGGAGIFYDRPQGNMVFDMISNAPGVLNSTLTWGRLQDLSAGGTGTDPNAVLNLNPTVYDFEPPKTYQWNLGLQHKLPYNLIADIAYVGSSNKDLLRQSQINAVPRGARYLPENQDPTLPASTVPGQNALTNDLLRPFPGYGNIRMWDYSGYSNYHALQVGVNRRFESGLGFGAFYVWSKSLTNSNTDFAAGIPNVSEEEVRRVDYSYSDFDRPHNFVLNLIYQTPKVADGVLGILANDWQLSGIYRWTSGRPYPINYSIPGIGAANLVGNDGNPNARVVVKDGCDPGGGWSDDPYRQIDTSCFLPPQVGSDGADSARFFLHSPPIVNLDLSVSKSIPVGKRVRMEVRLDMFNALNSTHFISVNNTVNFASLTDPTITNLPYDSNGNLVRNNGFGTANVVAPPRTIQLVTRLTF